MYIRNHLNHQVKLYQVLHRQRMIHDQLGRHHRIDLRRIPAPGGNGVAQPGKVDQGRLAEDIVANDARRLPGEVKIPFTFDDLGQRVAQHFWRAAAHQVLGEYPRAVGQSVVGTRLNIVHCLTHIEVIQRRAWQGFAVIRIHQNVDPR